MSRACSPGGRFTSDFETEAISAAIDMDLKKPVGSSVLWYLFNEAATNVDPLYDVGGSATYDPTKGKKWLGPYTVPVIKAVITQGSTKVSQTGFYNADSLHLTLNSNDVEALVPGVMTNPDDQTRSRIVWKNQVYRPYNAQQRGIISEGFTLLTLDCQQVMPEEMVNDPQFFTFTDDPL